MVRAGKVRYIGSCNFYGWQLVNADWVSKTERLTHFISAQNEFNLLQRNVEVEIGPACEACGLGLLPYHPLASGFLTGKYRPNIAPPEGARLSKGSAGGTTLDEESFDQLLKLEAFATVCGHTVLELAFSWLAGKSFVASVIAGATSPEQVSANAKAAGWKLTIAEYAEVDRILDHIPTDPRRGGASARRHTG